MKIKKVKAWAVLGYRDNKPLEFGSLKGRKGSVAIFNRKKDALKMVSEVSGWEVVRCEIIYTLSI